MKKLLFIMMLLIMSGNAYGESVPGAEGSACFANGTCNAELVCLSKICVKDNRKTESHNSWPAVSGIFILVVVLILLID